MSASIATATSGRTPPIRAHALIFGPAAVARLIAPTLEAQGFECQTADGLPSPGEPDSQARLRERLAAFSKQAGQPQSGFAHLVHPGAGPWADRPELSHICQDLGLSVLCPPVKVVSFFSNTLTLLNEAERLKIPNLVIAFDPISSRRELEQVLGSTKRFPVVLKSVRPIGASSLLVIQDPSDLERKFDLWMEQIRIETGEAIAFAERYGESTRHVTLPFARFRDGRTEFFPIIDGSLQSRYRRLLEVCPAQDLEDTLKKQMAAWSSDLLEAVGFVGVGSFDFLVDGARAFILGGLCRLGTTFRLWESVSGTSAVEWQLATLMESRPEFKVPARTKDSGAAICFRLYAEDPLLQLPQPGRIQEISERREWKLPGATGTLSLNYEAGQQIPFYDNGIFGLGFSEAQDRKRALNMVRGMLDEIWIAGSLRTNQKYLSDLVAHPWIREGIFHASFLDEEFLPEVRPPNDALRELVKLSAWWSGELSLEPNVPYYILDQWLKLPADAAQPEFSEAPKKWALADGSQGCSGYLKMDGARLRFCFYPTANGWQLRLGEWSVPIRRALPKLPGGAKRLPQLSALVGGRVHALFFREGSQIPKHHHLVLIESMRQLIPHALPKEFRLVRWHVAPEQIVQQGQLLAELESLAPEN